MRDKAPIGEVGKGARRTGDALAERLRQLAEALEAAVFAFQERVVWPLQDRFSMLPGRSPALIGGGAAGIELDCINTALGSPPNMLRLASSEGHTGLILLVNEEQADWKERLADKPSVAVLPQPVKYKKLVTTIHELADAAAAP